MRFLNLKEIFKDEELDAIQPAFDYVVTSLANEITLPRLQCRAPARHIHNPPREHLPLLVNCIRSMEGIPRSMGDSCHRDTRFDSHRQTLITMLNPNPPISNEMGPIQIDLLTYIQRFEQSAVLPNTESFCSHVRQGSQERIRATPSNPHQS